MALFVYKCLTFDLGGDLRERPQGQGLFRFRSQGLFLKMKDNERLESIIKGIVSDLWSTVIWTVFFIGF